MAYVVDIETIAADGIEFEPVRPPANYKDEAKIAAYVSEAEAAQRERAALYPWTARVIALGWCHEGDEVVESRLADSEAAEATMLRDFWMRVTDERTGLTPLVGFNHTAFDLPVLVARSLLLGVKHPIVNLDRYRTPHVDLMQILCFKDTRTVPPRSLKWFATRFGLNTDDAFSGALIAQLYQDRNWDAITKHVESDVMLTRQLAERIGVLRPRPVLVA